MAQMTQTLVLLVALATLVDVTLAVEYVVGGDVQKWNFLHSNDSPDFYNKWAAAETFKTGDILLFQYNNLSQSVLQVVEADYTSCNIATPIQQWLSGNDSVFLGNAGTFYYISGTPTGCTQGTKVSITVTGAKVAAPPPPPAALAPAPIALPSANHAAHDVAFSFAFSALLVAVSTATMAWS